MKLTAIIVDPSSVVVRQIADALAASFPMCHVEGTSDSAVGGATLVRKVRPDIVFAEVQLIGGTAFELLDLFPGCQFKIVILSSKKDYALKSFEYGATDYLKKPLDSKRLVKCFMKLQQSLAVDPQIKKNLRVRNFLSLQHERLAIPTKRGYKLIPFQDVIRLEADGSYVTIHTVQNRPQLVSKTLKHFTNELNNDIFMRVHRSHLINVLFVKEYCKTEGGYVIMDNGDRVDVATHRKESLLARILSRES